MASAKSNYQVVQVLICKVDPIRRQEGSVPGAYPKILKIIDALTVNS